MIEISYALARQYIWLLPVVDDAACACGEEHYISQWEVEPLFAKFPEMVPHAAVLAATMFLWGYTQVCDSFVMNLEVACLNVTGALGGAYSKRQAVDIAGYFTKTWTGCNHQTCQVE